MNFHSNSSSGMTMLGAKIRGMGIARRSVEVRWRGQWRGVHANVVLRYGDGDLVLLEQPPDGAIHFRTHIVDSLLRIGNPEPQLELDAAVAEVHQARHGRRFMQHARLTLAG